MSREYEVGLIINPEASEEEVEKIKKSVTDILEKGKGTIDNIDEWGRKKLAYPIEKHNEGIYIFIKTFSPGNVLASVERRLKLSEKVMRFIILRLDDKLKKTNRLEKRWKRAEKMTKKTDIDEKTESKPERRTTSKPAGEIISKPESRTVSKPEIKPEIKKESKPETKTEKSSEIIKEENNAETE
ncbi:MAG: 30S ribosomal protein S6 [Acidobacteriota bacterium]